MSDKVIANPDGLWLFNGQGINGRETQPWSVVLKILKRQEEETSPDNLWYWKREYLLAQSGLTDNLPVKAPRFYYSEELPEGVWIWMEHMDDLYPGQWTLDNYSFAAHRLGNWNSSYLNGTSLPKEDWLAREHYRAWLGWVNCEEAWQFPLNQKLVSGETMIRHKRLWNERERFFPCAGKPASGLLSFRLSTP